MWDDKHNVKTTIKERDKAEVYKLRAVPTFCIEV